MDRARAALTAADLQMHDDAYAAKQSTAAAVRYLRPILKWAAAPGRGYLPLAATLITPPAKVKKRDRVLSRAELAASLPVLRAGGSAYRSAMLFMLLTLARREKVASARWNDVHLRAAEWLNPETKNGTAYRVPLSPQAIDLLRRMGTPSPDARVFQSQRGYALLNWDRATNGHAIRHRFAKP